jgi:hypothetical protein
VPEITPESTRDNVKKEVKILCELIRVYLQIAVIKELKIAPLNTIGRADRKLVRLDRRMSAILRGQNIPSVRARGHCAGTFFPRRIFLRAKLGLKHALQKPALKFDTDTVVLVEPAFPTKKRTKRFIPVTERICRAELLRRGWSMRGGWSERTIGNYRLVLSGRRTIKGTQYINLTLIPLSTIGDALASAQIELADLKAAQMKTHRVKRSEPDTDFLDYSEEYGGGFSASLVNGPDINLLNVSGLHGTDELHDAVWGSYTWKRLLEECPSAEIIKVDTWDELPSMSDTFYWVAVNDAKQFRSELRSAIVSALKKARHLAKKKGFADQTGACGTAYRIETP